MNNKNSTIRKAIFWITIILIYVVGLLFYISGCSNYIK